MKDYLMVKKILILLCLLFLFTSCTFNFTRKVDTPVWVDIQSKPIPKSIMPDTQKIEATDRFKLLSPQDKLAINLLLNKHEFIELSPEEAQLLVGSFYKSEPGKKIFLVRTIGGVGEDYIYRIEDNLYIFHRVLGDYEPFYKSGLVINLDFTPNYVYLGSGRDQ